MKPYPQASSQFFLFPRTMKSLFAISILLFAAPFLLYFCDGHDRCPPFPPFKPYVLELENFEIFGSVRDEDGRLSSGLDGYRVDKTDAFNLLILLEDKSPWTYAFLRKSGEVYGFPVAMACQPAPQFWTETDPLVSVDIFMVDPLTMDTISVSKYLRFPNSESANAPYDISYPSSHDWRRDPGIGFTLGLLRTEAFPESAYFFGEALFSSGRILESPDTSEFLFQ